MAVDIFEKEVFCVLKIEYQDFKIVKEGLSFNRAYFIKTELNKLAEKDVYFIDLEISAKDALLQYTSDVRRFNLIINDITRLQNEKE